MHEIEKTYVKVLCYIIGVLGGIILAGGSFFCTWAFNAIIALQQGFAAYSTKIDDIDKNVRMLATAHEPFTSEATTSLTVNQQ